MDIHATVEDVAEVGLSGALSVPRARGKRAPFVNCSSDMQSQLGTAAADAQTYASNAYSHLTGISDDAPRYTTWFGAYVASRKSVVENHFQLISSHQFSSFTYDCTCTRLNTYAYVCACAFCLRDRYSVTDGFLD